MNLEDYWQENKRFVQTVALGVLVFFVALWFVRGRYQPSIDRAVSDVSSLNSKLRSAMFTRADLDMAREEGEALDAGLLRLRAAAEFAPRPGFELEADGGTPTSQYLRAVQEVKDELLPLCNRANMALDESLGLPELSPTREDDIERYLAALDLVDRMTRIAVDEGVGRLDKVRITLDSGKNARAERPLVEKTRVQFDFLGPSGPQLALLERLQRDRAQGPMLVADLLMKGTSQQVDEARLELTLYVARMHTDLGAADDEEEG